MIGQKSVKNLKNRHVGGKRQSFRDFGSGLRQGGGPRRGKERTNSPISADAAGVSGKYENQAFFVGGLGEGEFRGIGRIGIGRVGGRSLDIEKENSGRDLARRHKGDGGLMCGALPPTLREQIN